MLNPMIQHARAGLIDRFGLSKEFIQREFETQAEEAKIIGFAEDFIKRMAKQNLSKHELKALQGILAEGDAAIDENLKELSEPIRAAIDEFGMQLVELGLLDKDTYHRHLGKYLHRSYFKYETSHLELPSWAKGLMKKRRAAIYGKEFKARGLKMDLPLSRIIRDLPAGWLGTAAKPAEILAKLQSVDWVMLDHKKEGGKRVSKRLFWPSNEAVPDGYEEFANRGTWKVTAAHGGKFVLRRDFTREERAEMGEILDARYNVLKTFQIMAHDIAYGRFFKDISENPEWALKELPADIDKSRVAPAGKVELAGRLRTYSEVDWVQVPDTKISHTKVHKWGALAGMYVRPEIWRDLNEMDKMSQRGTWASILNQWKMNKTTRSPVVHMNNIMSNIALMDLIDVRVQDLTRGIIEYVQGGEMYDEARMHGAFGAGFVQNELRRTHIEPLLRELVKEAKQTADTLEGKTRLVSKMFESLYSGWRRFDEGMKDAYQIEDELFRMATYMRHRSMGASAEEAAMIARDQFLNYDIRAPWINAARMTVLPFISYTYRAIPAIQSALFHRPWKLAKYALFGYLANMMAYELEPGDEDEERRTMRDGAQGMTWMKIPFTDIGVHRMMRLPWRDKHGNPMFIDIYRWVPAGDVFETGQGQVPLLAWLQLGGPMQLASEVLMLNRSGFTGKDIVDWKYGTKGQQASQLLDYTYKAWMPSASYIPGSWHNDKLMSAIRGERDILDRPYSIPAAAATGFGVKVQPHDVELGYYFRGRELERRRAAIRSELRQIELDHRRGIATDRKYRSVQERERLKAQSLDAAARRLQGRE